MGRISARIAAINESATLAVDAKAKALKAAGENVIGFGAGEPDFPTPQRIIDAAVAAAREPRFHHYTPTAGLPELRAAIAHKTKRDSGVDCAGEQVLVTNGGKHAVYNTFQVLCDPGDEVLVPAPYWTSYPECIALGGGVDYKWRGPFSIRVSGDYLRMDLFNVSQNMYRASTGFVLHF